MKFYKVLTPYYKIKKLVKIFRKKDFLLKFKYHCNIQFMLILFSKILSIFF